MRKRIVDRTLFPIALSLAIAAAFTACPSTPVKNNPASNNGNAAEPASSVTPVEQTPTPANSGPNTGAGSLATPIDAYRTAHGFRAKKDIQGMKGVLSKEILEFFSEMGKVQNKSLDAMLLELCEKPQTPTAEARNEKITGNRAIIEYKEPSGEWKEMDFVKEGGEWKLTLPKAESR